MFLVGGYSQSSWLQEKITERFGDRLKIVLPESAFVSVLRGAVMYELNRSDTPTYKAKHSYAVGIVKPFIDNAHPIGKCNTYFVRFRFRYEIRAWMCSRSFSDTKRKINLR